MTTIELNKPSEITQIKPRITALIKEGYKFKDVTLILHFTSSDKVVTEIFHSYQKLWNHIQLDLDPRFRNN